MKSNLKQFLEDAKNDVEFNNDLVRYNQTNFNLNDEFDKHLFITMYLGYLIGKNDSEKLNKYVKL